MDCNRAKENMPAMLLKDLSEAEELKLRDHLAHCSVCSKEYEALSGVVGAQIAAPRSSENLTARIIAGSKTEPMTQRSRYFWRSIQGIAMAAAGLILAVGSWLFLAPPSEKSMTAQNTGKCPCWAFVGGDSGNSRRLDVKDVGVPESVVWQRPLSEMVGGYKPLAWKDLIIVGVSFTPKTRGGGGELAAFSTDAGKKAWTVKFTEGDFFKAKGFPDRCLQEDALFLTDGRKCLVLNAGTGDKTAALSPPEGVDGWNYLSAGEGRLYGASGDGRWIFSVSAADGRVLWRQTADDAGGAAYIPALVAGKLYVHSDQGVLTAFGGDGQILWRQTDIAPGRKAMVCGKGDLVLVLTAGDEIFAFDAAGKSLWRQVVAGAFASGVAIGENALYVADGQTALSSADGQVLWRYSAKHPCVAPTIAGGRLLIASGGNSGGLAVFTPQGEALGGLAEMLNSACEGLIVARGKIFAVERGRLLAVSCKQ